MSNDRLTPQLFNQLITHQNGPCVSIYLDNRLYTHGTDQALRAYRNALRDIESKIREKLPVDQRDAFMKPLHELCENHAFWLRKSLARAVFRSREFFLAIPVERRVKELAVVSDSFHTKPLIRQLNTSGRYQVLCLSQRIVELYEGNRDGLDRVELHPDIPRSLEQATGERSEEVYRIVAAHGGITQAPVSFAHKEKSDVLDNQLMHFFREVDRGIWAHHSGPSGPPLILCAQTKYHDLFRKVSRNENLLPNGIHLHPEGVSPERLSQEAWALIKPAYHELTTRLINDFNIAKARNTAGTDLAQVAQAAAEGRVMTLLVDADKKVAGRFLDDGRIELANANNSDMDDLLDDTAERVLKSGGRVMVIPSDLMPSESGLAAIYRY